MYLKIESLKDWVGQRKTVIGSQLWWNWEVDSSRYSDWKQMIKDLSVENIKVMTYRNPCLAPVSEHNTTLLHACFRNFSFIFNDIHHTH